MPPHMPPSARAIYASTGINLPSYRCPSMLNHAGSLKNASARRERRLRTGQPSLSSHPLFTTHFRGRTPCKPDSLRVCQRPSLTSHLDAQIPTPRRLAERRSQGRKLASPHPSTVYAMPPPILHAARPHLDESKNSISFACLFLFYRYR